MSVAEKNHLHSDIYAGISIVEKPIRGSQMCFAALSYVGYMHELTLLICKRYRIKKIEQPERAVRNKTTLSDKKIKHNFFVKLL